MHSAPAAVSDAPLRTMPTVEQHRKADAKDCALPVGVLITCFSAGLPLTTGNGGVESAPAVYLVRWGWTSDPAGMAEYQERFFNGIGGSTWGARATQYCDVSGDPLGYTCSATATFAGNATGVLKGVWDDASAIVPKNPTDADVRNEAIRAAVYFGN